MGDILEMKKTHPCGGKDSRQFLVVRIGMDFKIRCRSCGHEIMIPRSRAEKNLRRVVREGEVIPASQLLPRTPEEEKKKPEQGGPPQ